MKRASSLLGLQLNRFSINFESEEPSKVFIYGAWRLIVSPACRTYRILLNRANSPGFIEWNEWMYQHLVGCTTTSHIVSSALSGTHSIAHHNGWNWSFDESPQSLQFHAIPCLPWKRDSTASTYTYIQPSNTECYEYACSLWTNKSSTGYDFNLPNLRVMCETIIDRWVGGGGGWLEFWVAVAANGVLIAKPWICHVQIWRRQRTGNRESVIPFCGPVRISLTSLFLVEEGRSLEYSISPI